MGFGQGYFGQYASGGATPLVVLFGEFFSGTIVSADPALSLRSTSGLFSLVDTNAERTIVGSSAVLSLVDGNSAFSLESDG